MNAVNYISKNIIIIINNQKCYEKNSTSTKTVHLW